MISTVAPIIIGVIVGGLVFLVAIGYMMLGVASQDDDRFDRDEQ